MDVSTAPAKDSDHSAWSIEKDGMRYRPAVSLPLADGVSEAFKNKMAAAFLILSQSRTGRYALTQAARLGYKVAEDAADMRGLRKGGSAYEEKTIYLGPALAVEDLALTLGHEATHTLQEMWSKPEEQKTVGDKLKTVFAGEADAFAHQIQMALELVHGDPQGPKEQYINKNIADDLYESNELFSFVAALHDADEIRAGKAMPSFFNAFYESSLMRGKYERDLAASYEPLCQQLETFIKNGDVSAADVEPLLFPQTKIADQSIVAGVAFHGKPYLANAKLDFSEAFYAGVSGAHKQKIRRAFQGLGMSSDAMASLEKIPEYAGEAQDLLTRIRAAVEQMHKERAENNGQSPTQMKIKSGRLNS